VAVEVDEQPAHGPGAGIRRPGAPQHRLHPRLQLGEAERLDHVVVGPAAQAGHPVALLGPGGEHDDPDIGTFPQRPADVEAVPVGQSEVQQHQVAR
jgi:hypothetical protein